MFWSPLQHWNSVMMHISWIYSSRRLIGDLETALLKVNLHIIENWVVSRSPFYPSDSKPPSKSTCGVFFNRSLVMLVAKYRHTKWYLITLSNTWPLKWYSISMLSHDNGMLHNDSSAFLRSRSEAFTPRSARFSWYGSDSVPSPESLHRGKCNHLFWGMPKWYPWYRHFTRFP